MTESKKIKKIAEKFGAEVPFLRPKRLATSSSLAIDSYIYTIKKFKKMKKKIQNVYGSITHFTS